MSKKLIDITTLQGQEKLKRSLEYGWQIEREGITCVQLTLDDNEPPSLTYLLEHMHGLCMQLEELVADVKQQSGCYDDIEVNIQSLTAEIQTAIDLITPPDRNETEDELSDAYTSQAELEKIL